MSCLAQCDNGDSDSCVYLGVMYAIGKGAAKNPKRAVELYQKSCSEGTEAGCTGLGMMYAAGSGVPKNAEKAASLFQRLRV